MHDAGGVRGRERVGELHGDSSTAATASGAAASACSRSVAPSTSSIAMNGGAVRFADRVDRDDVRVVQADAAAPRASNRRDTRVGGELRSAAP